MSLNILVASGKGGTGKTVFSSSLALELSKIMDVVAVDADVDTPNLHLMLGARFEEKEEVYLEKAFAKENAEGCNCPFGAIKRIGNKWVVDQSLCEGCGFCEEFCDGYYLRKIASGYVAVGRTRYGFPIVSGFLNPGFSGSGEIVDKTIKKAMNFGENLIIDAAAGIGCPVISAFKYVDVVIFVLEPTKQSKLAFQRMKKLAEHFEVPWHVVLNKYNLNPRIRFPRVIARIPHSYKVISAVSELIPPSELDTKFRDVVLRTIDLLISSK